MDKAVPSLLGRDYAPTDDGVNALAGDHRDEQGAREHWSIAENILHVERNVVQVSPKYETKKRRLKQDDVC